jgi:hypothetical protein
VNDDSEQEENNYQGVNASHGELLMQKEWDSSEPGSVGANDTIRQRADRPATWC